MNAFNLESIQSLDPIEFENLVKALLIKMGFNATTTKASGDGGIDIIAINEQPIIGGKYVIQCKRYAIGNNIGEPVIRELFGVMHAENANKGILITTSDFSRQAINFAQDKAIELINGHSLMSLFDKYFEESLDDISEVESKEEDYKSMGNLKNEPADFRRVSWGSLLDTLKDMIFLEKHWLGGSVCYRISDSKKLGSAIIESPRYIFDEKGRFYLLSIEFQGKNNYELILSYLFKNYGKPFDGGNFTHDWFGENVNIHLQFTTEQSDGQVLFIWNPIYNAIDEALQKLDAQGFDELALGFRGTKWGSRLEDLNDFICNFELSNNTHKTCEKSTDKKIFAGVIVFPNYYFYKNCFYAIGIDFSERKNFETISDYLKKHYGQPYDIDLGYAKPHYKWRNNDFEIFVYYLDEDNRGYLSFTYLPIKKESDEEWQQKKLPIQQQKNQCFVASVIYGSSSADEVITLKLWRDNYLARYRCGRHFIKLYYKLGPLLASYVRKQKLLRKALRFYLDIFVHVLRRRK